MKRELIPKIGIDKVSLRQGVSLPKAALDLFREKTHKSVKPAMLLEDGFCFLLEGGGRILVEKELTKVYPPVLKTLASLCLENGGKLLTENCTPLQLETNHQ